MPFVLVTDDLFEAFLPCVPDEYISLFGDPQAMLIGMVDEDTSVAVGIIMGTMWGSTLYVDWLYVVEPFRQHGIGTMLLQHLIYLSRGSVQAVRAEFDPANTGLRHLFQVCLFKIEYEERNLYRITLGALRNHFIFKSFRQCEGMVSLSEVPQRILDEFSQRMELMSATVETPIEPSSYNGQLSHVCIHDQKITSCLLIQNIDKRLHLSFIYTQQAFARTLVALICLAIQKAFEIYPDSTQITMTTVGPEATVIVKKMFSGIKPMKVCITNYLF